MGRFMHQRLSIPVFAWLLLTASLLLGLAPAPAPASHGEEDFLPPDQAFVLEPPTLSDDEIGLEWRIADGYYLYRNKFRVQPLTPGVTFGEPKLAPAEKKQDPIFGEVEVYHRKARLRVPVEQIPASIDRIELKVRYQGCADKGICYPPQVRTVSLPYSGGPITAATGASSPLLSAPASRPARDKAIDELAALGDSLGLGMEDDILPPDQAYRPSAESPDGKTLVVRWQIAEGTYLYEDKVRVDVEGAGVSLGAFDMPKADIKKDSIRPDGTIGDVAVYHRQLELRIPLLRENPDATEIGVQLFYQ